MIDANENRISILHQGVEIFQDELDSSASVRAFNNVVMLDSEAVKLDDRRIDTQIRRNGWADILRQLHAPMPESSEDSEVEETEEVEETTDS